MNDIKLLTDILSDCLNRNQSVTKPSCDELKKAYLIAKQHNVAQIFAFSVIQNKLTEDEELLAELNSEYFTSILRYREIDQIFRDIFSLFEKENIDFIPLKGMVIRDFYPKAWMRSSRDIDILVKPNDHQKACEILVSALNFKTDHELSYDTVFNTPKGLCVEIHKGLADGVNLSDSEKPLLKVWDTAIHSENSKTMFSMDNDLFLYYFIYHTAKHFLCGGCGIRAVIDFWLLKQRFPKKSKVLLGMLSENGLLTFTEKIERLSDVWFSGIPHDEETLKLEEYIVKGGQSGDQNVRHITTPHKRKSRIKYYFSKLFISFDELKQRYPILEKHPLLSPFCAVHRFFSLLFGNRKTIRKSKQNEFLKKEDEKETLHKNHTTKEKVDEYSNIINIVGFELK